MMKRKTISLFLLIFVFIASLLANPVAAAATQPYTPVEGPIFNNPNANRAREFKIINEVVQLTDHAPKGSTIRIGLSHLTRSEPTDALLRAHKRGVTIRMVVHTQEWENLQVRRLRKALGEDDTKPSYIVARLNHAKLFVFSKTAGKQNVVFTTSAPMQRDHAVDIWNDGYTVIGNQAIYDASVQFIKAMTTREMREFPRVTDTTNYKWFLLPANEKRYGEDVFTRILNHINCDGGQTVVDLPVSRWREGRMDVVRKLDRLQSEGCQVRVSIFITSADKAIMRELYERQIPTRIQSRPQDVPTSHLKQILISGKHFGQDVHTVYTGSANLTPTATQATPNVMLRIKNDKAMYTIYKNKADHIWENSHPLTPKHFNLAD